MGMTQAQYKRILITEFLRLAALDGADPKAAKAVVVPATKINIDELKYRNRELRNKLTKAGVDHRNTDQQAADAAEIPALLDRVAELASAGGHDGAAKRAACATKTAPELRKLIAATEAYQARQARDRQTAVERAADRAARDAGPATPRQVAEIMRLLGRRSRDGEGGGFMIGPTERAGVEQLCFSDASMYINSLTGNY